MQDVDIRNERGGGRSPCWDCQQPLYITDRFAHKSFSFLSKHVSLRETPVVLLLLRALFRAVAFARSLEGGICCTCSPLRVPPHPTHRPSAAFGYPRPAAARQLGGSSLIGECKCAAASSSSLARRTSVWEGRGGHAVFISAECLPATQLHCVVAVRSSVRAVRHKTAGIYHLLYKIPHERSKVRPSERERGGGAAPRGPSL